MTSPALLFVLRHAHAAKAEAGQEDRDRPLDARGLREAAEIGAAMAERGYVPARVACSPSTRTRMTLEALGPVAAGAPVEFVEELYSDGVDACLTAAASDPEARTLLLVGHNPTFAELAETLAGERDEAAHRRLAAGFPPAALAVLEFPEGLASVRPGAGTLRELILPTR